MATAPPPNVQDFLDIPYRPASRPEQVTLRMRRTQSSSAAGLVRKQPSSTTTTSPRRSIFPQNGGINAGWNLQRSTPNASTTAIGRSLLDRPKLDNTNSINMPENLLQNAKFSKCAASTPILHRSSTDLTLKSCLSSSNSNMSMLSRSKSSTNGFNNSSSKSNKNEEFNLVRNVSFSHSQVRTYETTLGDNPSVSSGAPLSLGWRYDPNENIQSLQDEEDIGIRRSMSELRLSDRERQRRISSNPNISYTDLHSVLQSVAETRLERKLSLNELRREKQQQKNVSCGRRRSGAVSD